MANSDVVVDRRPPSPPSPPRRVRGARNGVGVGVRVGSGGIVLLLFPILLLCLSTTTTTTLVDAWLAFASSTTTTSSSASSFSSRVGRPFRRRRLVGPGGGFFGGGWVPTIGGREASAPSLTSSSSGGEDRPWDGVVASVRRRKDGLFRRGRRSPPSALASSIGGGGERGKEDGADDDDVEGGVVVRRRVSRLRLALEKSLLAIAILVSSYWIYDNRVLLLDLFDREKFKSDLLVKLRDVETLGLKGLVLYSSSFALWEFVGAPTVPVETMAGMAFGIRRGFLASGIGKLTGAFAAYWLGRDWLNDVVRSKFEDSEVMKLVDRSSERKPFKVALTMKYSSFPELTKNFGLGILPSVRPWMFLLATCLHGLPFTMLWTCLGHDSATRLKMAEKGIALPPSKVLHGFTIGVAVFGCVFSPILVGMWINEMRKEHVANVVRDEEEGGDGKGRTKKGGGKKR